MNGDDLKDRRQGDPARETARRYNLTNAVIRDSRARRMHQTGDPGSIIDAPCDVPVQNIGTNTIAQYGVLGIGSPLIDPSSGSNAATAFQQQPISLTADVPQSPDDAGKFVVAQEPIAPNGIGTCRIAGITRVQVNIISTDDTTADVTDGDATQLTSGSGPAEILWAPDGLTGTQWCIVRLGGGGGLPPLQYPGECYVAKSDLTVSGGFYPLHEMNEGV